MIHNPQHYVRDFYFFKRSQYPQLALVHKKPEQAYVDLQRECLTLKFTEIGKVMLIWGILKNVNQVIWSVILYSTCLWSLEIRTLRKKYHKTFFCKLAISNFVSEKQLELLVIFYLSIFDRVIRFHFINISVIYEKTFFSLW